MAKYNCNVPWAILLDPTSACNLRCTGCWAAEYGHNLSLDLDTLDSIIRQGKKLGTYMYIYTGGEPMVRKDDLIRLCELHPDCEFLSFTNGTLIDEAFCQEMLRVKNFIPSISLEGFEAANDGRRGSGRLSEGHGRHGSPQVPQAALWDIHLLYQQKLPGCEQRGLLRQDHRLRRHVRLVLPLYAGGQRRFHRAAPYPGAAHPDVPPHPGLPSDQIHLCH